MKVQAKILGALVLAAACDRAPEGSPTEAAMEYIRGEMGAQKEGVDYTLAGVHTVSQAPGHVIVRAIVQQGGRQRDFHLRIDRGARWTMGLDYEKSFQKEMVEVQRTWDDIVQAAAERIQKRNERRGVRIYKNKSLRMPTTRVEDLTEPEGNLVVASISKWHAGIHFAPGADGKTLVPFGFVSFDFDYHPRGSPAGGAFTQNYGYEAGRWFPLDARLVDRVR